jgi:hypothetical protein
MAWWGAWCGAAGVRWFRLLLGACSPTTCQPAARPPSGEQRGCGRASDLPTFPPSHLLSCLPACRRCWATPRAWWQSSSPCSTSATRWVVVLAVWLPLRLALHLAAEGLGAERRTVHCRCTCWAISRGVCAHLLRVCTLCLAAGELLLPVWLWHHHVWSDHVQPGVWVGGWGGVGGGKGVW